MLEFGPTPAFGTQLNLTPGSAQYEPELTGLAPATSYWYRIVADGQVLADGSGFHFTTAPEPNSGRGTEFVLWGDSGKGSASQTAVAAVLNAQQADFGLIVGDIMYSDALPHHDDSYFVPYAVAPDPALSSVGYALTLPALADVAVRIFDVRGRLVRTLHDGAVPGGTFTATWDGRDESGREVESGIYFVRTYTEGRVQTDKLALLH